MPKIPAHVKAQRPTRQHRNFWTKNVWWSLSKT